MKLVISEEQYRKLINDKKFINFFNLINESYLSPEQLQMLGVNSVEELYKLRTERLWDNIFGNEDRIYLPYDNVNTYNIIKDNVKQYFKEKYNIDKELSVEEYKNNRVIYSYLTKIGQRKDNQEISLTTVLGYISKNVNIDLVRKYEEDGNFMSIYGDLEICISRDPIDIAAMSTNRRWTSCQTIVYANDSYKCLPDEITNGTCVAYLIRKDDKNIDNPLARVAIRTYYNVNDPEKLLLYTSQKTYPPDFKHFREQVHEYIGNKMEDIEHDVEYRLSKGSYDDDSKNLQGIKMLNKGSFVRYFQGKDEISIDEFKKFVENDLAKYIPKDIEIEGLERLTINNIGLYLSRIYDDKHISLFVDEVIKRKPNFLDNINIENIWYIADYFIPKDFIKKYKLAYIFKNLKEIPIEDYIDYLNKGISDFLSKNVEIEELKNISVGDIKYIIDFHMDSLYKKEVLPFILKILQERPDYIKTITTDNIGDILYKLEEEEMLPFIKLVYNMNPNFISGDINDMFSYLSVEDKSTLVSFFTKKDSFIKKIDEDTINYILKYSKRPIVTFKRLPKEKRLLIKSLTDNEIRILMRRSINKESVNKILKHYNMI